MATQLGSKKMLHLHHRLIHLILGLTEAIKRIMAQHNRITTERPTTRRRPIIHNRRRLMCKPVRDIMPRVLRLPRELILLRVLQLIRHLLVHRPSLKPTQHKRTHSLRQQLHTHIQQLAHKRRDITRAVRIHPEITVHLHLVAEGTVTILRHTRQPFIMQQMLIFSSNISRQVPLESRGKREV